MTDLDHDRALEAAVAACVEIMGPPVGTPEFIAKHSGRLIKRRDDAAEAYARAAVDAYQAAMPPRVSPELIAGLNALASRLTQMGEYEAVDLIDTVVARLTPAAQETT